MSNRWVRCVRKDDKTKSAEIVLNTKRNGVDAGLWYHKILENYEHLMGWKGIPVQEVDIQGGGEEVLVEVVVCPYFPLTLDLIVRRHEQTLNRIYCKDTSSNGKLEVVK